MTAEAGKQHALPALFISLLTFFTISIYINRWAEEPEIGSEEGEERVLALTPGSGPQSRPNFVVFFTFCLTFQAKKKRRSSSQLLLVSQREDWEKEKKNHSFFCLLRKSV
jgi:hypothetical protein